MKNSKPIIFNTEIVKAILEGRKTQTRRICNFDIWEEQDGEITSDGCQYNNGYDLVCSVKGWEYPQRPTMRAKYKKDDILWIREPAKVINYDFPSIGDILNNEAKAKDWVIL